MNKSWYHIRSLAGTEETQISIHDEIGYFGISAKQFVEELAKVPPTNHISLSINSPGGSVFEGNLIYNALRRHGGGVTVQIEALAASIASVIALAGSPVAISANGFYMIHNPINVVIGDAAEMEKQASLLKKISTDMAAIYSAKTGIEEAEIVAMMDAETYLSAQEALDKGFVDEITDALPEPRRVAFAPASFAFRNPPQNIAALLQTHAEDEGEDENQSGPAAQAHEKLVAILAERDTLKAGLAAAQNQLSEVQAKLTAASAAEKSAVRQRDLLAKFARTLGVSSLDAIPSEPNEENAQPADPLAQWQELSGSAKTEFYFKNRAAILAKTRSGTNQ